MRKILIISLVFILSNCVEPDQQLQQDHIGFSGVDTLYFDNGNIMSEDIYEIDICRCLSEPGNTSWSQKNRYTCRDAISQRLGVENWEEVSLDPKVSEGFDRLANSCGY